MKGVWNNSEVISLFKVIEEKKEEGLSLRQAFEENTKKYNRKTYSMDNRRRSYQKQNRRFNNRSSKGFC